MLVIKKGQVQPEHQNTFVLTVKGYFGDGDEYFTEVICSSDPDTIEKSYRAYQYLKQERTEDRSDLPKEYTDMIKGSSWDYEVLPSGIDEMRLFWYDANGYPNDVVVE